MLTPATGRPAVTHVETRLGTIRDGGNNIQATITRDSTKPALASATRVAHDKRSSPLQREREGGTDQQRRNSVPGDSIGRRSTSVRLGD